MIFNPNNRTTFLFENVLLTYNSIVRKSKNKEIEKPGDFAHPPVYRTAILAEIKSESFAKLQNALFKVIGVEKYKYLTTMNSSSAIIWGGACKTFLGDCVAKTLMRITCKHKYNPPETYHEDGRRINFYEEKQKTEEIPTEVTEIIKSETGEDVSVEKKVMVVKNFSKFDSLCFIGDAFIELREHKQTGSIYFLLLGVQYKSPAENLTLINEIKEEEREKIDKYNKELYESNDISEEDSVLNLIVPNKSIEQTEPTEPTEPTEATEELVVSQTIDEDTTF